MNLTYLQLIVSTARREIGLSDPDMGTHDYDIAIARTALQMEQKRISREVLCRVDPEWKRSIEDVLDVVCPYSF